MASTVTIVYGEVAEGSDPVFRRLLSSDAGVALVQSDVSAIDLKVYQGNSPGTPLYTAPGGTFTTANMSNTLQTDGWTLGGSGYNFKARVPAASVPMDGGENYRYEFIFTLTNGLGIASAIFIVKCVALTSQ
jgi:hypothetical protein